MGTPSAGSRLGTHFGSYELQELIGVGGMGEVYRAFDTVRERMVALKLLRTDVAADPTYRDRFRRESRIAARLQEPHVIPVHDFGEIDGVLYIDMRLVEGASVKEELRVNGVLPPARAVAIIGQVAAALDAAHANGLVHRDIKPENVLLTSDDFAYLVDFGIAYGGGEATVTKTGMIIGSCAYMATERLGGQPGGPASDVYSLTCLLYECLTGRAPFEGGDLAQVMSAHMFFPPPRPSLERRGINPAFDAVVAKGMAKDPADRYGSAGELAGAAAAVVHGRPAPVAQDAPTAPQITPQSTRQYAAFDPRPNPTGYVPQPPPAPPVPAQAGTVRPDAGGAAGRHGRDARRGRRAGRGGGLHRGQRRLRTPDAARRATPVDDHRHDDCAVAVRGVVGTVHHDEQVTVTDCGRHGPVGCRRAGLRRARGPLRRGQHAGGGDQDRVVPGGGVRDGAGQLLLPRRTPQRWRQPADRQRDTRRRRVRRDESGRRRAVSGAARRADHLEQRARRLGGGGAGVRRGLGGGHIAAAHGYIV